MSTKLVAIVAILWVAAVGAITVAFVANRSERYSPGSIVNGKLVPGTYSRTFETGGWLAWVGAVTLVGVVALAIILVVFRNTKRTDG